MTHTDILKRNRAIRAAYEAGLTQSEIAKKFNLLQGSVSKICRGVKRGVRK